MKILIAEDQPVEAHFLRRTLEKLRHDVIVASDGEAAWQILGGGGIDVLISDWMMPRLSGPELCRLIRAEGVDRYTYLILLTSCDRREDKLNGLRAGADDFLTKPTDTDELAVRLEVAERRLAVQSLLTRQNRRLVEMATTDELTGLKNRRRFNEDLSLHAGLTSRSRVPLSLLMIDVDHFKRFNDSFGHLAGDEVLRAVAMTLRASIRQHDIVARYGGEEFVVLLPATEEWPACEAAMRVRSAVEQQTVIMRTVTASIGVATMLGDPEEDGELVSQADQALYLAKRSGRNCVRHFRELSSRPLSPCLAVSMTRVTGMRDVLSENRCQPSHRHFEVHP
jgi:diguanylate cyclase (GGDEF)-like protein